MNNFFNANEPISIYGCGNSGRILASNLIRLGKEINYFIDQKANENSVIDGIKCINPSKITEEIKQVVIGVFNRDVSPREIKSLLKSNKVMTIIGYNEINHYLPGSIPPTFWYDSDFNYSKFSPKISEVKKILDDHESILTLEKILTFRQTGKVEDHPDGIGVEKQYFDKGIKNWLEGNGHIMIDCGAFDGDTIFSAIKNKVPISKAYCFEPDLQNFSVLTTNLKKQSIIDALSIPCATWDKSATLYFNDVGGENSRILSDSTTPVQAISIDEFIGKSPYNFLKIDVEGAELETLNGALESIKLNRPYIAVAIYHKPTDIWEIPLYLSNHLQKYSFYIRQYGHNCFDTVLYCCPCESYYY